MYTIIQHICCDHGCIIIRSEFEKSTFLYITNCASWRKGICGNEIHLLFSPFSPFVAVSLCWVAVLAETFPLFPIRGPFLPNVPGFQVPPDSIFLRQLRSSSTRALPLNLHFNNCSDVFSFTSSFDVPEPFQPSPFDFNFAMGSTFASSKTPSFLQCSSRLTPLPIAPFLSLLLPYPFHI